MLQTSPEAFGRILSKFLKQISTLLLLHFSLSPKVGGEGERKKNNENKLESPE